MSMKIRIGHILLFLMLVSFAPNFALAGTLPNRQPSPDTSQCGAKDVPNYMIFGFSFGRTIAYTCQYSSGPDAYTLYFDSNKVYLGGIYETGDKKGQTFNDAGEPQGKTPDPKNVGAIGSAAACSLSNWNFQDCFFFPLMSWLGSWFLTVNGFLVWVAGGLFDVLVQRVIIGFGQTLSDLHIAESIGDGWRIFRDVGNIVIIGMFVFIAISMILGLKTYGDKKLVANLLIIAVLINFSLLFTRMIVDFSNFTAFQFYKASAQTYRADPNNFQSFDVASAFLTPMGITSIWNTDCLTRAAGGLPCSIDNSTAAAAAIGETSGWRAFVFGLAGGLLLAGVWFVLFYGSFHIAARAIAIIFLMLTGAIAFTTYLVPKLSDGDYGWKAWWGSLINAAIFAPLLMIFLFISLQILRSAKGVLGQNGGLNTFINAPTGPEVWKAIFIYLIAVGLLFASIKVSSKVSSSLGTGLLSGALNIAGAVAAGGAGLISRFAVAPVARRYIGAPALARAETRGDQAKTAMDSMRTATSRSERNEFAYQALRRKSQEARNLRIADSKMNVMDTAPMKSLASRFGLKGVFSGQSAGDTLSFAGKVKRDQETMSKLAESIRPNADDLRQKKRQEIYDNHKDEYDYKLKRQKDMATEYEAGKNQLEFLGRNATETKKHQDKVIDAIQQVAAASGGVVPAKYSSDLETIKKYDDSRNGWKDELAKVMKDASQEQRAVLEEKLNKVGEATSADHLKNIEKEILQAVPENMRATVTQQLNESKGSHESEMRHESSRIEAARRSVTNLADSDNDVKSRVGDYDNLKRAATAEFTAVTNAREAKRIASNQATTDLTNFVRGVRLEVQQAEKDITQSVADVMPDVAEVAAARARPWYRRQVVTTKAEQVAEEKLVKDLKKKQKQKLGQNVFAGYEERGGGGSGEGGTPPKTT
ncbi:MAG TPA: hypothetical protein VJK53_06020 [Candidatus Paceibacterota bacterium]